MILDQSLDRQTGTPPSPALWYIGLRNASSTGTFCSPAFTRGSARRGTRMQCFHRDGSSWTDLSMGLPARAGNRTGNLVVRAPDR